jgi:hypothetical protein
MELLVNDALVMLTGVFDFPCGLFVPAAPLRMRYGAVLAVEADAGCLHNGTLLVFL